MARLEGKWAKGKSWLSITPIKAGANQDATLYEVQFCAVPGDRPTSREYSVVGWLDQHTPIWLVARAFIEARSVVESRIPADLWHTGRSQPAALYEAADWLVVVMFGNPKQKRLAVRFFLQEGEDPEVFRSIFINASLEAVQEFGRALECEIIEACPNWWAEHLAGDSDEAN